MILVALVLIMVGLLCLFSGLNQWRWWWSVAWRDSEGRSAVTRYGVPLTRLLFGAVGTALLLLGTWTFWRSPVLFVGGLSLLLGTWLFLWVRKPAQRKRARDRAARFDLTNLDT